MPNRRLWTAVLGIGCAVLGGAASALDDPAARAQVTKLDNGLVVVTLEDSSTPVVSFQMWVKVGSRDEAGYTGLAHLFEHMMFNGSKHLGPEQHADLLAARGGSVNAYTANDQTVYFDDVTRETLPLVIDLEYERLAYLDISEQALDRERQVVLEERRMRTEDSPMGRAYEALFALTWQALPYRTPPIGWRSDVEKATAEVCRKFFSTYYAPNNIVVAIAGDFDTKEALAHIRRTLGKLEPAAVIPRNPTEEPEQRGERRAIVKLDVHSPLLAAAWHAPKTGGPDAEPLDVLSVILSDGRSSRLYRSLVHDAEVALAAQGAYWEFNDAGAFVAFASVRPGKSIADVEKRFMAEIARLRGALVTEAELEKAKRQLEVSLVNGLETSHALADRIGQDYSTLGRIRPLDERLARIRAVTAADVQRVARAYLVDDQRSVVQIVPMAPRAGAAEPAKKKGGA
jgi:predicted Zn-dependent peptidase